MAITTDTTTLPGYTIVTDGTGGIAVIRNAPEDSTAFEYTIANEIADKLTIIASHLENIRTVSIASSAALQKIAEASNTGQITMKDPLAWMGLMSVYKLYAEDSNGTVNPAKLEELKSYKAKIDAMIASLS